MNRNTFNVFQSRFFWKLFCSFVIIFSVTIATIFIYLFPGIQVSLKADLESKLDAKINLLRGHYEVVSTDKSNSFVIDTLTDDLAKKYLIKLAVFTNEGIVIGDSGSQPLLSLLQNKDDLVRKMGSKFELRDESGVSHLYTVAQITNGYLMVGLPYESIERTRRIILMGVAYSFLPALFFAALMGFVLARRYTTSVNHLLEVARQISQGNFVRYLSEGARDEVDSLGVVINLISTNLEIKLRELMKEKQQLAAILDSMLEGVLVTNEKSEVILANKSLLDMFSYQSDFMGRGVLECFRNNDLHDLIISVAESGSPAISRFVLQLIDGERYVLVHSSPFFVEGMLAGTVTVLSDISDVRKLETFRREFVANVSHELKTPLTNIIGYTETLEGALDDPKLANRFLDKILKNANQLKLLVDDLLELSAIESGRMLYKKKDVTLKPVLLALKADYNDWIERKKLVFTINVPGELMIQADLQALKQIFRNLMDNAIKYTPEHGTITIEVQEHEGSVVVCVRDTGIGVEEKDLQRIFERFFRAEQSRSRDMGGTGLGLSIVKHLVSSMGWDIDVKSEPGKGCEFIVIIPM